MCVDHAGAQLNHKFKTVVDFPFVDSRPLSNANIEAAISATHTGKKQLLSKTLGD